MRTKIDTGRTMRTLTADDALAEAQPKLRGLVERAHRQTGSLMLAYGDVGRIIGASSSWVRKAINGQADGIQGHVILNITARYEAACARWDAEADLQKQRFLALGRGAHEMDQSKTACVDLEEGGQVSRVWEARSVVASLVDRERQ